MATSTNPEQVTEQLKQAFKELVSHLSAVYDQSQIDEWINDVSSKAAEYAVLAAKGDENAIQALSTLKAIAQIKAARLVINGQASTTETLVDIALTAAQVAKVFVAALL